MSLPSLFASLASWPFDPAVVIGLVISAVLYWLGAHYMRTHGLGRRLVWWRTALFGLGLIVIFLTLNSPLDGWSDQYLWAHMLQHELLALVGAPLLLLGEPWLVMWRGIPLSGRRATARWFVQRGWPVHLFETLERFFRRPVVSWLTFVILFSVWHLPSLYDLATENPAAHAFEHICFIFGGLVFWSQFIPSFPFKVNLNPLGQTVYFFLAALWGNVLGWPFMFSTAPSYSHYTQIARAAGMISAITDQHLAGGVMDAADTALFISCTIIALGLWLQEMERRTDTTPALATPTTTAT